MIARDLNTDTNNNKRDTNDYLYTSLTLFHFLI